MVGIVVIGRNEGERLRACLSSLMQDTETRGGSAIRYPLSALPVVYVDSGSTDGSVQLAQSFGAEVVELDLSSPFSAARARNEGFARLMRIAPRIEYVHFVDGDCTMTSGWLQTAAAFLGECARYAAVAGRLRERYPEHSIYNRLCDLEWNTPPGEVPACGGIAMYRVKAFERVGRFDESVVAGEEPELCLRLRQNGWKIRRLEEEMALHDAAMTHFRQWWRRTLRGGYAYAMGNCMHGAPPERHWMREVRSNWLWGLMLPLVALGSAWWTWGASLLLLCCYFALALRVYRHMHSRGFCAADARLYAFFCVLAKFPHAQGQLRYWRCRLMAKPASIVEYKGPAENVVK